MKSEFITKDEAFLLLGWNTMSRSGNEKMRRLKQKGLVTTPQHSQRMFYRKEILAVLDRLGSDLFFSKNKETGMYELTITSIKAA